MTDRFKKVSEWAAQAGDAYNEKHTDSSLTMGVIDKSLRQQGVPADAVSVEIPIKQLKLIVLIPDDEAQPIEIISGNKEGDIFSSIQATVENLSKEKFLDVYETEFSMTRD